MLEYRWRVYWPATIEAVLRRPPNHLVEPPLGWERSGSDVAWCVEGAIATAKRLRTTGLDTKDQRQVHRLTVFSSA